MYLQHWRGWCHMKLQPSWRKSCVHHTTMHHAKPHTWGVCVFSSNLPPALFAEWPGSFMCYFGNTGVERIYQNKSQHRNLTLERKILRRSYRDSNPQPFNHKSGALTIELSLQFSCCCYCLVPVHWTLQTCQRFFNFFFKCHKRRIKMCIRNIWIMDGARYFNNYK